MLLVSTMPKSLRVMINNESDKVLLYSISNREVVAGSLVVKASCVVSFGSVFYLPILSLQSRRQMDIGKLLGLNLSP